MTKRFTFFEEAYPEPGSCLTPETLFADDDVAATAGINVFAESYPDQVTSDERVIAFDPTVENI